MSATGQNAGEAARFDLIVLVASLGGLHALSTVIAGLPAAFTAPVLVVQHGRDNGHPDRLATLLQKRSAVPVRTASDGVPVRAAGVTVIPSGFGATIDEAGCLALGAADPWGAGDQVLGAAAAAAGPRCVGVVLTGMLRDGAEGVRAVKRRGGRVLAQDPVTARAGSMPAAAIATGCVDFVLPLQRVAPALVALAMAPGAAELLAVPVPPWASLRPQIPTEA